SSAYEIDEALTSSQGQNVPLLEALLVPEAVDLVIRTGGARVLSDFLPVQSAYAQIAFMDDLWNDITLAQMESLADRVQGLRPLFGE
ncbi:MAG: undecaprenyl diphosphate synthase family protein, partial [Actinomycetota bacterium]|nr:undecaprenyl diphosphate synthase family protein [Actinomycetota bacterium]